MYTIITEHEDDISGEKQTAIFNFSNKSDWTRFGKFLTSIKQWHYAYTEKVITYNEAMSILINLPDAALKARCLKQRVKLKNIKGRKN